MSCRLMEIPLMICTLPMLVFCSAWTVMTPKDATAPEQQAKKELEHYLPLAAKSLKIDGHDVEVIEVKRDDESFADEEYEILCQDKRILLHGGGSRGALYAAYSFLENQIGVHWWPISDDYVPPMREVELPSGRIRFKPSFLRREIWTTRFPEKRGGRWFIANRLNHTGNIPLLPEFGEGRLGAAEYGKPFLVHTFDNYCPSDMLDTHPEFFGLWDGKRVAGIGEGELCLTNKELRNYFKQKLKEYILADEKAAREGGYPPPLIYSVSQNDNDHPCQCPECRAFVQREGAESNLLLDFVNELADELKDFRPNLYLDTLAYRFTTPPPKHTRPRPNVIIRYCDVNSDYRFGPLHPVNKQMHDELLAWSKCAKTLSIWDYHVLYGGDCSEYAAPSEFTYPELFKFYKDIGTQIFFIQSEEPIKCDMYELKVWLAAKYLENPEQDFEKLRSTFMTCYYGDAAPALSRYRDILREEALKHPTTEKMTFYEPPTSVWDYLSLEGAIACLQACEEAEQAVASDPVLLLRARHAAAGLHALVCTHHLRRYRKEWLKSGKKLEDFPIQASVLLEKYIETRRAWGRHVNPEYDQERLLAIMHTRGQAQMHDTAPLPPEFTQRDFIDMVTEQISIPTVCTDYVKLVEDPASSTGYALRIDCDSPAEKYTFPLPQTAGVYGESTAKVLHSISLTSEDVQPEGYHWHHLGRVALNRKNIIYVGGIWAIQARTDDIPDWDGRLADVYVSIRFEGPQYRYQEVGANAIYVDRVAIVAAE